MTRRSAGSPSAQIDVGALVTSCATRQARARNFCAPVVETSSQLMSSSTGPGERDRDAHGVGARVDHARGELDQIALALGHLRAAEQHHALVDEARERLGEVDEAHVEQDLGDEARVQQVQDRVLDAADVGVDGRPACPPRAREKASVGVARREEAQEVPRAVDEGVHRVGVAQRRLTRLGIGRRASTRSAPPSGDVPFGREVEPLHVGQRQRQLVVRARARCGRPRCGSSGSACPRSADARSASRAGGRTSTRGRCRPPRAASMMRAIALRLDSPSSDPELIIRPSPVSAMPVVAGSRSASDCARPRPDRSARRSRRAR